MRVCPVLLFLVGCLVAKITGDCNRNLLPELSYKLSGTALAFPCEATKNIYLTTGRYVPKSVIATRMQIFRDDAIVAMPRLKHGVPFTLGKFSLRGKGCEGVLQPFPCWAMQEEGNCEALQNVVDIFLDPMDILWILDLGIVNTLEQPVRRCPPKIVGVNALTGQIVKIVDLTPFMTPQSRFQYMIVDYSPEGNAFVYASDAGTGGILVYDVFANKGYRVVLPKAVSSPTMNTDYMTGNYMPGNDNYNNMPGRSQKVCDNPVNDVLYIALARKSCGNVLYFTYLSSPRLFSIKASLLQKGQASGAVVDVGPKPPGTRIVLLGTDNGAALFFRYKGESDIYIWNSETPFKTENFLLVQKGGECRLSTQVVPGYKKLMWTIESNFHDYISNTVGCLGASMAVHPLVKVCD